MRRSDPPSPPRPTAEQLASAAAVLAAHGVDLRRLRDGRYVLSRGGGLLVDLAEGHAVVSLAGQLEAPLH